MEKWAGAGAVAARSRALRGVALGVVLVALGSCASRFEVEALDAGGLPSSTVPAPTAPSEDASTPLRDAASDGPDTPRDGSLRDSGDGDAPTGDAADGAPLPRRVFRTSTFYAGSDIAAQGGAPGVLGADALCARVATAAGLGGAWSAWISDDTQSAATRVTAPGPYYDVARTKIVFPGNPASSTPLGPIPDQTGLTAAMRGVWTGTSPSGKTLSHCGRWAFSRGTGTYGLSETPASWTNGGDNLCSLSRHLYCFER